MPRPKKTLDTKDPLGQKINLVMTEKGIAGDYGALAKVFGVTTASAREWVQLGRMAKERYTKLAEWSGRSLDWWFDVPTLTTQPWLASEPSAPYGSIGPAWPFREVTPSQYATLDSAAQSEAEAFIKGMIAATRRNREAA